MSGFPTLLHKELLRFWKVAFQTILAPIVTAMFYLLIFSHVLEERVQVYPGISYTTFLVPGLIMMAMLQNAFANSSSSLIQSKITGNIIFVLVAPLSYLEFFLAYLLASVTRGVVGHGADLSGEIPELWALLETSYLMYRTPPPDLRPGEVVKPARREWLHWLAWTQWSHDEIAEGLWAHLL